MHLFSTSCLIQVKYGTLTHIYGTDHLDGGRPSVISSIQIVPIIDVVKEAGTFFDLQGIRSQVGSYILD